MANSSFSQTFAPLPVTVANGGTNATTAADARTNLGLVAGGTGDIWVEKAGDTMTGNLVVGDDHYLNVNGTAVFNETGADADFRIESDANQNMFFVDASTNRIGINTNTPSEMLHINNSDYTTMRFDAASDQGYFYADGVFHFVVMGSRSATPLRIVYGSGQRLDFSSTENVFNDNAANIDTRIEGDTDANLIFVDASTDRVGIGTASPSAKLDVNGAIALNSTITGATGYNGLVVTANTGVVTTGTWSATTIAVDKGGTGQTSYTDGQLLIGNSTGNTLTKATLTGTSNQITVTNGGGSITLSTPQNIHTAASPTFAGLNLGTGDISTMGDIAMDGDAVRDITTGRKSSAAAGATLTIQAGGAHSGDTDTAGGNLILASGIATGNSRSAIQFNVPTPGSTGTTDTSPAWAGSVWQASSNGPVISTQANSSTTGLPLASNAFAVRGNVAGGITSYRHTTSNTAGNNFTVQAGGATSAATDKAGGDLLLKSGISTGTANSKIRLQTYTAASSTGTSDNTATDRIVITSPKILTDNSAISLVSCTIASGSSIGGVIRFTVEATDGTDYQSYSGEVVYAAVNKGGTVTATITEHDTAVANSTGTITTTWAMSAASPSVISLNANTSLASPSTGYPRVTYTVENYGQQAISIQ